MSAILRNKKLIFIVILAVVVAAVAWHFLKPAGTPPGLAYGNGRLEATETAVATKVQGKLIEVYFREGADLKTGQIAAQLDDAQLKADIRAAEAAVEQAKARLANARNDLSYTVVRSPADGVVGTLPYRQGALVGSTMEQPLTVVSDNSSMYVYFSMNESRPLDLLQRYGSAEKAIKGMPDISLYLSNGSLYKEKGRIESISGVIDRSTGSV